MFKVECPGCKAPYQVDERRVPPTGLKMRCPKCGTSFQVDPPPSDPRTTGPSPVLAAPGGPAPGKKKPPLPAKRRSVKPTVLGVAAPAAGVPRPGGGMDAGLPRPDRPPRPPRPDPTTEEPYGEVDLPTVGGASHDAAAVDLPAVPERRVEAGLPAVPTSPEAPQPVGEADLPAVPAAPGPPAAPASAGGGGFGEIDLFSTDSDDLPAVRSEPGPSAPGLPAPVGRPRQQTALGGIGLPSPSADLPSPSVGLPSPVADLPAASADLPSPQAGLPQAAAGLPQAAAGLPQAPAGLPQSAAGLPQAAAGLPQSAAGLPQSAAGLPQSAAGLPSASGTDSFGELDLPGSEGAVASGAPADGFGAAPPPPPDMTVRSSETEASGVAPPDGPPGGGQQVVRQAGGGTSFGEVNLPGAGGAIPTTDGTPAESADDDMEFGGVPQEDEPRGPAPAATAAVGDASLQVSAPVSGALPAAATLARRRKGRARVALLLGVLAVAGGGALALVPDIGPFGYFVVEATVNKSKYDKLIASTVAETRRLLAVDTNPAAMKAFGLAERARASAKRLEPLAAYTAYVAYQRELRFGVEPEMDARAKVILNELSDEKGDPRLDLARAAQAAMEGQLARARQSAARLGSDIDVLVLRGEIELRAREPKAALEAWTAAAKVEASARTEFGLARSHEAAGDLERARVHARAALEKSKAHAGARIMLARIDWQREQNEAKTTKLLQEVLGTKDAASNDEAVEAQTLLGQVHLARGRISHAEQAFGAALKIDPKAAGALNGFGDALYRAGRYSQALARFEAGAAADADDIAAKVGVAKTKIALERLEDAKGMLKKLREVHAEDMGVQYWYGMVEQKLGNRSEAEAAYRAAIKTGQRDPAVVNAYVALALLLNQLGRGEEARAALEGARDRLPQSPALHKAIGTVALSQGRYDDAIREYRAALRLDADNLEAKFQLGVALRRNREFEAALVELDQVSKVDRDYPGLALERGLLYQESGREDEALSQYEKALRKAPDDPDLMLRVGCSYVTAGRAKEAEALLKKVLAQRANSAETNHCLGRALLLKGKDLTNALRQLERATAIDPHRAQYWLYVGWAANEAGDTTKAATALKKALELDRGLADAYWQRGVLRRKGGAVKDAIKDLTRALELKPNRQEAHADLAACYYDLNRERDALDEWRKAVDAFPENARFRYHFGRLLNMTRNNAEAKVHLLKAIELSGKMESQPPWLSEAHRLAAMSLGRTPEAAKHWKAYLRLSSRDHVYRAEAKAALKALGQPWDGD